MLIRCPDAKDAGMTDSRQGARLTEGVGRAPLTLNKARGLMAWPIGKFSTLLIFNPAALLHVWPAVTLHSPPCAPPYSLPYPSLRRVIRHSFSWCAQPLLFLGKSEPSDGRIAASFRGGITSSMGLVNGCARATITKPWRDEPVKKRRTAGTNSYAN